MFQDIAPQVFHNEFHPCDPVAEDYLIFYQKHKVLLHTDQDRLTLPQYGQVSSELPAEAVQDLTYLFTVGTRAFFLAGEKMQALVKEHNLLPGLDYQDLSVLRHGVPNWLAFGAATGGHLGKWYHTHKYCGCCRTPLRPSAKERALVCPECGLIEYPRINPVVIIGVTKGEELLLTQYAHAGYKRHALVAGFVEFGETLEEAVRREVREEVGLEVKNFHYYKSQPWAFSESILAGFFVEVEGKAKVQLNADGSDELATAVWFQRGDLPQDDVTVSLTWDMIEAFRRGEV